MGLMFFVLICLGICWLVIYLLMHVVCWLKQGYCKGETFICRVIEFFECEECKRSCDDRKKMVRRAFLFALVITTVIVMTRYFLS